MTFQGRVVGWLLHCLPEQAEDRRIRSLRFIEEASELVQALGLPREDVVRVVEMVYSHPAGKAEQEVGGTLITLAALCHASRINMELEGEKELTRVTQPGMIAKIRERNKVKPT